MIAISVVMPVYNTREEFLREAVESILNQSFGDFEFIIVNDGSTNNVEEVIKSYDDKRIIYIKNEKNIGIIKSLNNAFKISKGKYIARMDSDDISYPLRFETQYKYMEDNSNCGVCSASNLVVYPDKIVNASFVATDMKIKYLLLFRDCCIFHSSVLLRKSMLEENKLTYNEEDLHAEDYGLWLNMIDKTQFYNIEEVLLLYRFHDANISVVHKDLQKIKDVRLKLKFQKKYLNFNIDNLEEPLLKLRRGEKLTSIELSRVMEYYLGWFDIKELSTEEVYTKRQILGLCKKAVLKTKPDLLFFFAILKPKLIKNLILRHLNLI